MLGFKITASTRSCLLEGGILYSLHELRFQIRHIFTGFLTRHIEAESGEWRGTYKVSCISRPAEDDEQKESVHANDNISASQQQSQEEEICRQYDGHGI